MIFRLINKSINLAIKNFEICMKNIILFLALILIFSSCAINKKISYDYQNIEATSNIKFSELILDIEILNDKRKELSENQSHFENGKHCKLKNQDVCINSEKHYIKSPVNEQFTQLLANHLNAKKSFKKILVNNKDSADYYIIADLTRFLGKQLFSKSVAASAQMGIVGALATIGSKTNGKIIIEVRDIKIYNKNHQLVGKIDDFKKTYDGDIFVDAYCWCIYDNVNATLQLYNSELISLIENEISKITE